MNIHAPAEVSLAGIVVSGTAVSAEAVAEALTRRGLVASSSQKSTMDHEAVVLFLDEANATHPLIEMDPLRRSRTVLVLDDLQPTRVQAIAELGVGGIVAESSSIDELADVCAAVAAGQRACCREITHLLMSAQAIRGATTASNIARRLISPLTRRETEIARLIADGLTNKEIAGELTISPATVKAHVQSVLRKSGCSRRHQLLKSAWWPDVDRGSEGATLLRVRALALK